MKKQYPCPSCFVNLSANQQVCPNCGKPNPYYGRIEDDGADGFEPVAGHAGTATAGKCAWCDSVLYSDEKVCSHCGAPNPNFVVHGKDGAGGTRMHGGVNASTGKCPYCGGTVRSNERQCPTCGSVNPYYIEDTARVIIEPKTIDELKEYCAERDMPLLRMRFFIGEDVHEPKAFGIFKDGVGMTIVYKNKADGSRAVRYHGPDEAYAVKEILKKLKEECRARGIDPDHSLGGASGPSPYIQRPLRTSASYRNDGAYPNNAASNRAVMDKIRAEKRQKAKRRKLWIILLIVLAFVLMVRYADRCTALLNSCSSCFAGSGGSSGGSYSNGGSYSSWDWGGSDSGSSWDWGGSDSNDWDSWDSDSSDWDSDW